MAFKASNILPQKAYDVTKNAARQLKVNLQGINAQLAASGADYTYLSQIYFTLQRADTQFNNLKSTPGLAQYAKDQENDPLYDVAAEFTAMQAAITDAITWMDGNIPTNVTARAPTAWVDGETLISNSFTPAQTNGLRTELSSVIAMID